jgi:hypothetical protein
MVLSISGRTGSGKDTVGKIIQFLMHTEGKWDERYFEEYTENKHKAHWRNYWEIKKFAGKLKQIASLLTGVPVERFEDQEFKAFYMTKDWQYLKQMYENDEDGKDGYSLMPMTYREFLQKLGTEAVRNGLHPNTWVNALFADYITPWNQKAIEELYGQGTTSESSKSVSYTHLTLPTM